MTAYNRALDFYQETEGTSADQAECFTALGRLYEHAGRLKESGSAYAAAARLRWAAEQHRLEQEGPARDAGVHEGEDRP
jgi:hypothetical protein